jgi:response regulator RpfG family c-di-GMP phosphodiesterase
MDEKSVKVLIVDDMEENRIILVELVKMLKYKPITASDGLQAMHILKKVTPDMILLDIEMPEMNGYQVLEELQKDDKLKHIPVVMVTTIDAMDSIVKCIELGAEDYLTKPIEPTILKARINQSLAKFRHLQSETELLEKTLGGSVRIFVDILSTLYPQIFSKAARVRRLAVLLGKALKQPDQWTIEVAALLSMVGCITIPSETIKRILEHGVNRPDDKKVFDEQVLEGSELVSRIPRLNKVAEIIKFQNKDFDGGGFPIAHLAGEDIPMGSRILHVVNDYDTFLQATQNPGEALKRLHSRKTKYDTHVLSAMDRVITSESEKEVKSVSLNELLVGMTFAQDVVTQSGSKIASQWQEVSIAILGRIKSLSQKVTIKEPIKIIISPKDS